MATTQNLGLYLFDENDSEKDVEEYVKELSGNTDSSNMVKIDNAVKDLQTSKQDKITSATAGIVHANSSGTSVTPLSADDIPTGIVTRDKLANDAKYSPVKEIPNTVTDYTPSTADIGLTLTPAYSNKDANCYFSMNATTAFNSANFPVGTEIAFVNRYHTNADGKMLRFYFKGLRVRSASMGIICANDGNAVTKKIPLYGMVVLKKMETDAGNGDLWLLFGEVE